MSSWNEIMHQGIFSLPVLSSDTPVTYGWNITECVAVNRWMKLNLAITKLIGTIK